MAATTTGRAPAALRAAAAFAFVVLAACSGDGGGSAGGDRANTGPLATGPVEVGSAAERADLTVTPVQLPSPARVGRIATAHFRTRPGNSCQMELRDSKHADDVQRLDPATTDADGLVSWAWKVDDDVSADTLTAVVICSGGARGEAVITVS